MQTTILKKTTAALLLCLSVYFWSGCELRLGDPESDQARHNRLAEEARKQDVEKKNAEAMKAYREESDKQLQAEEKAATAATPPTPATTTPPTDPAETTTAAAPGINPTEQFSIDKPETNKAEAALPSSEPVLFFATDTLLAVFGGGTPPTFTIDKSYFLTEILTYHWNDGKSPPPGTVSLKDASGKTYGPWQTTLRSGVYWIATPSITLPAGTYTLLDSDPGTWSQNEETGGAGVVHVTGIPVK